MLKKRGILRSRVAGNPNRSSGTTVADFSTMIALGFLAALLFSGVVVMVAGLHNAPEGYETNEGFHLVWCNRSPEVKNIVCIWEHQPKRHDPTDQKELRAAA